MEGPGKLWPEPFRASLALSIDCDGCTVPRLEQILGYWAGSGETPYGKGLGLAVASSMFVYSRNPEAPPQAAYLDGDRDGLREAWRRGWIDTLHGLGDFSHGNLCTRDLAKRGFDALAADGIRLPVWTNHGGPANIQDLLKERAYGDVPGSVCYLTDLAEEYGILFVWSNRLTPVIGQERPTTAGEYYMAHSNLSRIRRVAASVVHPMSRNIVRKVGLVPYEGNRLVEQKRVRDGREFFVFHRYGRWRFDTISKLPEILTEPVLDRLVESGGVMIVYLHIGPSADETPENLRAGLKTLDGVARRFQEKKLWVAKTSDLLTRVVSCTAAGGPGGRIAARGPDRPRPPGSV